MNWLIILLAFGTFLSTLLGGFLALKFKKILPLLFAFASGSLIAVAFFDLLPESLELADSISFPTRYIMLTIVFSFLLYTFIEKYFLTHHHHEDGHAHILGPIGAGSLVIHSFLDGAAIGAAFQVNFAAGIIVAVAVLAHDFTDGINTVTLMLKNKHKAKHAKLFLLMDAIAPVLGVIVTSMFVIDPKFLVLILAFFVGEFLYIGAANLLPETHKHRSWSIIISMLLAAVIIYAITSFL